MRYIKTHILADLEKKMVFIGGPRQVGKTTLARNILEENYSSGLYFNWDYDDDRRHLIEKHWSRDHRLLVFDELHKYPKWKGWIKGIYDVSNEIHKFLVTGSARLDVYRRGGDSLLGRYHYWRLHPFSLDEVPDGMSRSTALNRLLTVGGFPEPFLDGNERNARRWRRERFNRILREDIRDLEPIRNIQTLGLFTDVLRQRVGSLVTIANIAQDLETAHKTLKNWLEILERMYLLFCVRPFTRSLPRAVLKPPKVYFFDNADVVDDEGAKFENLIATNILKRIHYLEDRDGYNYELKYIRDKEGREVDFAVLREGVLEDLIEVKYSDNKISGSLQYYAEKLQPKRATQIVATLKNPYDKGRLKITDPISYFCS